MKLLRMRPEYVEWTKTGRKTCTTRTKNKGTGRFELASGSRYKPVKSNVGIDIRYVLPWTRSSITDAQKRLILREEGFLNENDDIPLLWSAFLELLEGLNRSEIGEDQIMFSHFYRRLFINRPQSQNGRQQI
jgi:hypothetical protein